MNTSATTHVGCPHCGATNRIPDARLGDDPVCGRCGVALLDGQPLELTELNFDTVVKATGLPVVVDFWAEWCGPCRSMAPHFAQAARQLKGRALFVKVNSDDNQRLAGRFGIRSIPTLLKLQDGREVDRASGAMPAAQVVAWVNAR